MNYQQLTLKNYTFIVVFLLYFPGSQQPQYGAWESCLDNHRLESISEKLKRIKQSASFIHTSESFWIMNKIIADICQLSSWYPVRNRMSLKSFCSHLMKYDGYFAKFAFIYAMGILIIPFVWMFFGFSGYAQTAICIMACVSFSGPATRIKGQQRFLGCFVGCIFAFFLLGLSIDNLFIYLLVLFVISYLLLYFRMGGATISTFGMQAAIIVVVGGISGEKPTLVLDPSLQRLAGIFLGICGLLVIQRFFWSLSEYENTRHSVK